jgi:serine/threonine-protein kinase 24/25/MST4
MAPEVIRETGTDQKADIWSLGITCLEMAKGAPPYADLNPMQALVKIPKAEPAKLDGNFSDDFKDFVSKCLIKDSSKRWSSSQLLEHPWILKVDDHSEILKDLIEKYFQHKQKKSKKKKASNASHPPQNFVKYLYL